MVSLLAALIGALIALQAPLNAKLGETVGGLPAAAIALTVSAVTLLAVTAIAGRLPAVGGLGAAPLYALVGGGLIGGLYVASIIWTVRVLGAGGLTASTLAGQLTCAVTLDHFGWLGVARSPVTPARLAGVALLAAGTYLVVRD